MPRTRWLVAKLTLVTGGLVVFGAAITAVMTWYRAPMDRVTPGCSRRRSTTRACCCRARSCARSGSGVAGCCCGHHRRHGRGVHRVGDPDHGDHAAERGRSSSPGGHRADHLPSVVRGASTSSTPPVTGHLRDLVLNVVHHGDQLIVDVHTGQPVLGAAAHRGRDFPRHRRGGAWHGRLAATSAYHLGGLGDGCRLRGEGGTLRPGLPDVRKVRPPLRW